MKDLSRINSSIIRKNNDVHLGEDLIENQITEYLHIYTRVSTSHQEEDGTSLESQLELGIERSKKIGLKYKIWNEGGKSSSKDDLSNRPVLTELLSLIDEGEVQHLYVYNTDRLSRNLNTWGMIRFKLIKNNVILHTPTGPLPLSDPTTNLLIGVLTEISQYENQIRTERFRQGKLKRIKQGGWIGGPPPFGYSIEKSKLVPNKEEQKWVRFIFECYKGGDSLDDIRSKLLKNSVQTRRGNPVWCHSSIEKLLTNTHYGGHFSYTDKKSDETIRLTCPRLLPSSLIKSVRDIRNSRSYGKRGNRRTKTSNQKYTYLLTELLVCGHCGSFYGGNYKKTQTSYYSCRQKTEKFRTRFTDRHVVCGSNRNIRIDRTDEIVWETVVDVISKSHLFKEDVKNELLGKTSVRKSQSEIKRSQNKLRKLKKEIDEVTHSIINFETSVLIGNRDKIEGKKIVKNLEIHRETLESQVEEINQSILEEEKQKTWIDWVKEFGSRIEKIKDPDFSIEDRKSVIKGVVNQIVVSNKDVRKHELKIEFRLPYVGDSIEFKDQKKKSKGYKVKNGRKIKGVIVDLLKKTKV